MELAKYRNGFSEQQRRAFRASLGIEDHAGVLVSVSRLSKEKNIRELISLFPELQKKGLNVMLLIVGDGPDRAYLERMTDRLQLRRSVIFTGRVRSEDVWQYYASGDVFVSASTFEVHSMSYLEAMANGLPLLCREDDSLRGVLEHGKNGLIYHSRQEFVDYAYRLLRDDDLRNSMARCSQEKAEGFSEGAFAASMLKVYEAAIRETTQNSSDGKAE
jgi:1,2-diacylglycerol 3-alpha-glucosyltransferase